MTNDFFMFEDGEYDLPFLNDDPRFTARNVGIFAIHIRHMNIEHLQIK